MIPGLAELLLVANLTVGAPAIPSPVATVPTSAAKINAQAVRPLEGALAQGKFDPTCCNPIACGCSCLVG
jgi:hypothetical protein